MITVKQENYLYNAHDPVGVKLRLETPFYSFKQA